MRSNPAAALAFARSQRQSPTRNWTGMCLAFCRQTWGLAGGVPDANASWRMARDKRTSIMSAPAGAPVWWAVGKHGHIAIADGKGNCYSTDIRRRGKVDLVPIGEVQRRWRAQPLGWSPYLNGHRLPLGKAGTAAPATSLPEPGQRGARVAQLQRALIAAGFEIRAGATGFYGAQTIAAVRACQRKQGFSGTNADGRVGAATWKWLQLA